MTDPDTAAEGGRVQPDGADSESTSPVTVYWRPGCGFCSGLMRSLDRSGLAHRRRNIWEDDEAAAFVRSVTGGSETVPTVTVGDRALVNPTGDEVLNLVADVTPDVLPDDWEPRGPGLLRRLLGG